MMIMVSPKEYEKWKARDARSPHFHVYGPIEPYQEASRLKYEQDAREWLSHTPEQKEAKIQKFMGWDVYFFGMEPDRAKAEELYDKMTADYQSTLPS